MIGAVLVVTVCIMGAGGAQECNAFGAQSWYGPALEELEDCATMAEELVQLGKRATCELVLVDKVGAEQSSYAAPEKPHRVIYRYQGSNRANVEAIVQLVLPEGFIF